MPMPLPRQTPVSSSYLQEKAQGGDFHQSTPNWGKIAMWLEVGGSQTHRQIIPSITRLCVKNSSTPSPNPRSKHALTAGRQAEGLIKLHPNCRQVLKELPFWT